MEETQTCVSRWKKATRRGYTLYDSGSVTFWRRQNLETAKRSVVAGGYGEGRMIRQSTEEFQGSKAAPYDTVVRDNMSSYVWPNL